MDKKIAIIIGAGPAGLAVAYELLTKTDIKPIVFEASGDIGGIAKSICHNGNILDLGGHRYFSKSEKVNLWWQNILPLQGVPARDYVALKRHAVVSKKPGAPDPEKTDQVMLIRHRSSRIFFSKRFINYPLTFELGTILNIGLWRTFKMAISYFKTQIFPIREEKNLEEFFINRLGKELYSFFFKSFTQKLWGVPCNELSAEWGIQRIKGVSILKLFLNMLSKIFIKKESFDNSKNTETSLIEYFAYPKLGAGQLWQEVARFVTEKNGEIYFRHKVIGIDFEGNKILGADVNDEITGEIKNIKGDYFFSSMPVKELIQGFKQDIPADVRKIANSLKYRDFITVGVLLKRMKIKNKTRIKTINDIIPDNWIYIQDNNLLLGRVQIFNNWSPYMIKDKDTIWVGLEYFCSQDEELWNKNDTELIEFALDEFSKAGFIDREDVLDSVVVRIPKAYPIYCGGYKQLYVVRRFTDTFTNLFLIGRNGMHRYNNMDHSILTAMIAVENILGGIKDKENIWSVNTEHKYCEKK